MYAYVYVLQNVFMKHSKVMATMTLEEGEMMNLSGDLCTRSCVLCRLNLFILGR